MLLSNSSLALWQYAEGRSLNEISFGFHIDLATPQKLCRAALACLAEAGLLERDLDPSENEEKKSGKTTCRSTAIACSPAVYPFLL